MCGVSPRWLDEGRFIKTGTSSKSSCGLISCWSQAINFAKLTVLGLSMNPYLTSHLIPIIDFVYDTSFYLLSFSLILTFHETVVSFLLQTNFLLLLFCLMWISNISDRAIFIYKYKIRGHGHIKIVLFTRKVDYPDLWVISIVFIFEMYVIRNLLITTKI